MPQGIGFWLEVRQRKNKRWTWTLCSNSSKKPVCSSDRDFNKFYEAKKSFYKNIGDLIIILTNGSIKANRIPLK